MPAPIRGCSLTSTRGCAGRCGAKPSCSSRASCATTAASLDFLTASDTFVNERLAKHYGIPNVYGDNFRRVALPAGARRGLLGQASILTVTSYAHRTSPVLRGKWMHGERAGDAAAAAAARRPDAASKRTTRPASR